MKKTKSVFREKLIVINLGLPSFADDLQSQGVEVTNVDWKPPAGGDQEMLKLLDRLGS
jgi:hypothetical protein